MIPYKEYTACNEAERRVLTTSKSTSGEEENWDKEPQLPPQETPSGAKSMALSQEDEWKLMVDQDPHSGSVAGDFGHCTMAATGEDEPIDSTEELGAVGGVDESVAAEDLSDVKWRDDDPLFMFNDENVSKSQTPAAALTPVQTWKEEDKAVSSLESPHGEKALLSRVDGQTSIKDSSNMPQT